mgnify:CR=1 FL=1
MALNQQQTAGILSEYQRSASDSGSPEVQVALLTANITELSGHFKVHNRTDVMLVHPHAKGIGGHGDIDFP